MIDCIRFGLPGLLRETRRRRGWGLLQTVGSMFAGSLVLGVCVPLFITAQQQADLSSARARMTLQAREISSHFREDIRRASAVQVGADGRSLRLFCARPEQPQAGSSVTYLAMPGRLLREVRASASASGPVTERSLFAAASTDVRFSRTGRAVTAGLDLSHAVHGRTLRYHLECEATPRSTL